MNEFQPQRGKRENLMPHERQILEQKILPTAKKWLREFPQLAHHARQTLEYWGEHFDDPRPRTFGDE